MSDNMDVYNLINGANLTSMQIHKVLGTSGNERKSQKYQLNDKKNIKR